MKEKTEIEREKEGLKYYNTNSAELMYQFLTYNRDNLALSIFFYRTVRSPI